MPFSIIFQCVFDKATSGFNVLIDKGFVNDIEGGADFWLEEILDEDIMLGFIDAFDLIKSFKNKERPLVTNQSDQLGDIINNLAETSNPVIVILYP